MGRKCRKAGEIRNQHKDMGTGDGMMTSFPHSQDKPDLEARSLCFPVRAQGWTPAMRDLYILLPALAYGNKSMEGKTQLSVNLEPSETELISPPTANYCHEIKRFVLFGECQAFNGKTRRGRGGKQRKKPKKASYCRCWNLFARPL